MWIVAVYAAVTNIVLIWQNARNPVPLTRGICKQGVAPQTEVTTSVNRQGFWLFRMVERRTVAVFTGDDAVQILGTDLYFIIVTLTAVLVHFLFSGIPVL